MILIYILNDILSLFCGKYYHPFILVLRYLLQNIDILYIRLL